MSTHTPSLGTPRTAVDRFLAVVERSGNLLPHPATLFFVLT